MSNDIMIIADKKQSLYLPHKAHTLSWFIIDNTYYVRYKLRLLLIKQ